MDVGLKNQEESKLMRGAKEKIERRLGERLFLKGERSLSPKAAIIKRPYPPGQRGKRRRRPPSEYAKELREKQKLRYTYNIKEKQFRNYVKGILAKRGKAEDASSLLIKALESRLDNVVFRLGFTLSRSKSRQLVSHSYFLVNGRAMNFPAHQLKKGDIVSLKPEKTKKNIVVEFKSLMKKYKAPSWIELNTEKLEGKIVGVPTLEEVALPIEISAIFEFYSR
ncbi:MAG: 30S ribosomal protein S4 [Patescibacteria group bacterium]|nr:30S ribosomal protein S4 [Patescibacteria group bacterium]